MPGVFGSVGPDATAEIRQVSCIQSSIVNSALSIHSFLGDIISFVCFWSFPILLFLIQSCQYLNQVFLFHGVVTITTDFVLFCITFFQILIILITQEKLPTRFLSYCFLSCIVSKMSLTIAHLCSR